MWIATIVSTAVLSFAAGVIVTVVYLVFIAKDVEETNTKFEASLSQQGKKIK